VLADGIVVGRIFLMPIRPWCDVDEQPQWSDRARGARLRTDARGRAGGVGQELAAAIKALGAYLSGKLSGLVFQKKLSIGRSGRI